MMQLCRPPHTALWEDNSAVAEIAVEVIRPLRLRRAARRLGLVSLCLPVPRHARAPPSGAQRECAAARPPTHCATRSSTTMQAAWARRGRMGQRNTQLDFVFLSGGLQGDYTERKEVRGARADLG